MRDLGESILVLVYSKTPNYIPRCSSPVKNAKVINFYPQLQEEPKLNARPVIFHPQLLSKFGYPTATNPKMTTIIDRSECVNLRGSRVYVRRRPLHQTSALNHNNRSPNSTSHAKEDEYTPDCSCSLITATKVTATAAGAARVASDDWCWQKRTFSRWCCGRGRGFVACVGQWWVVVESEAIGEGVERREGGVLELEFVLWCVRWKIFLKRGDGDLRVGGRTSSCRLT
jgi:hypothetical protein